MTGKNISVTLSDHFLTFVKAKISEGRYASTSEVIRAGLRLLEKEEQRLQALYAAMEEGFVSPAEPFDFDAFIAAKRAAR